MRGYESKGSIDATDNSIARRGMSILTESSDSADDIELSGMKKHRLPKVRPKFMIEDKGVPLLRIPKKKAT